LVAIRSYLLKYASNENAVTIVDKTPTKVNQKPYSVLYVSGNPNCGTVLIPLLLDLHWFSVKWYSFIYVVIIYLLVVEGKHYIGIGGDYIQGLYSIINKKHEGVNFSISQQIIDLLLSESNYAETEQEGILKVIESRHSRIQKVHTTDSYVLVSAETDNVCFGFKSNMDCAKYFEVSKVTVGRWITKNSYISTTKGVFCFKKAKKH